MPAWITSLLREETPEPIDPVASATTMLWPAMASARAQASPTTPAPMTRISISFALASSAAHPSLRARSIDSLIILRASAASPQRTILTHLPGSRSL